MRAEPTFDFRELVRGLDARGVRFLVFGRQAMRALGSPVFTQDYDLWFDPSARGVVLTYFDGDLGFDVLEPAAENAPVVKVHAGVDKIDAWFVRGMVNREGQRLDFDGLYERSLLIGDAGGLSFRVPSIDDLIALKRMGATVRPKDEEDIQYLLVRKHLAADGRLRS